MGDITLLIIILLVVATFLRIDFVFYIVYVLAGIYFWSRWYTPRAFRNVQLTRTFVSHAFLGERVTVTLTLHNPNRLPLPWLQAAESVPPQLRAGRPPNVALSLGRNETRRINYVIQPRRRGYYRLGPLHLRSGDLFGWSALSGVSEASYLTVYPRITPLSRLGFPSRVPFGSISSNQRLLEDPSRPSGVRDYRSGDSLRQINWKVSAHADNLFVRTLQPAIALDTAVVLNLAREDYERRVRYSAPEWAIEIAASLATHLIEQQQSVGLISNGRDPLGDIHSRHIPAQAEFDENSGRLLSSDEHKELADSVIRMITLRTGRAHLMSILELLARIETAASDPFATWIPQACSHLNWGVTVTAITPKVSDELFRALHHLVRAGLNPVLILTTATHRFGAIESRARQLGFSAFHIPGKRDLATWQQRPGTAFKI